MKIGSKSGYVIPHASITEIMADRARPLCKGFLLLDRSPWTAKYRIIVKSIRTKSSLRSDFLEGVGISAAPETVHH